METAHAPLAEQHATEQTACGNRRVPHGDDHRLGDIGALPGGIGAGGLQQGRRAAVGQAPERDTDVHQRRRLADKTQHQRHHGKSAQAEQNHVAQVLVDQRTDHADTRQGGDTEGQQDHASAGCQPHRSQERHDVGVQHVMRQHPGEDHQQHRQHSRGTQNLSDAGTLTRGVTVEVRHLAQHPGHQHQGRPRHQGKGHAPPHQFAQPGAGWHPQRQRHRRADHRHCHGPALLLGADHAPCMPGDHAPGQAGGDAGHEACDQRQPVRTR
ncbi:hypothetical protein D3C80_1316160 [compost metagenome]